MIDLDIPTFLRIPQEVRRVSWRGRKLTKPKAASVKITRNEDASTRAFRRMIEKKEAEKKASRFAMLRERGAEKKRQASWVPVAERKPYPSNEGRCERPDDAGEHGADAAARSVGERAHEGPHLLFTVQIVHVEAERCQRIVNSLRGSRAGGVLRYLADLFWRHAGHDPLRLQAGRQRRGDRHYRICGLHSSQSRRFLPGVGHRGIAA